MAPQLLTLPREMRNQIYEHYLPLDLYFQLTSDIRRGDEGFDLKRWMFRKTKNILLLTCHRVFDELEPVFLRQMVFELSFKSCLSPEASTPRS
jgi:hypothetical protein